MKWARRARLLVKYGDLNRDSTHTEDRLCLNSWSGMFKDHGCCSTFKTRMRDWKVNIVTEVTLFQNVQQGEKEKCLFHVRLKPRRNSGSALGRDSDTMSVQYWPELLWEGQGHAAQTLTQKSWVWVSNGCTCSPGFVWGLCKAAVRCVAWPCSVCWSAVKQGTFIAVWMDVQFKHTRPLSAANLKVWPSALLEMSPIKYNTLLK